MGKKKGGKKKSALTDEEKAAKAQEEVTPTPNMPVCLCVCVCVCGMLYCPASSVCLRCHALLSSLLKGHCSTCAASAVVHALAVHAGLCVRRPSLICNAAPPATLPLRTTWLCLPAPSSSHSVPCTYCAWLQALAQAAEKEKKTILQLAFLKVRCIWIMNARWRVLVCCASMLCCAVLCCAVV